MADIVFISVGGDCQVSYQIRKNIGQTRSLFFDWLITPMGSLASLFENEFTTVLSQDLQWVGKEGDYHVTDLHTGLIFMHDFKERSLSEITMVRDRYLRRGERIMDLVNKLDVPLCFVRRWHSLDGSECLESARELCVRLNGQRPGIRTIYLHHVKERPDVAMGGFMSGYIEKVPNWTGDDERWSMHLVRACMLDW